MFLFQFDLFGRLTRSPRSVAKHYPLSRCTPLRFGLQLMPFVALNLFLTQTFCFIELEFVRPRARSTSNRPIQQSVNRLVPLVRSIVDRVRQSAQQKIFERTFSLYWEKNFISNFSSFNQNLSSKWSGHFSYRPNQSTGVQKERTPRRRFSHRNRWRCQSLSVLSLKI